MHIWGSSVYMEVEVVHNFCICITSIHAHIRKLRAYIQVVHIWKIHIYIIYVPLQPLYMRSLHICATFVYQNICFCIYVRYVHIWKMRIYKSRACIKAEVLYNFCLCTYIPYMYNLCICTSFVLAHIFCISTYSLYAHIFHICIFLEVL